MSRRKSSTLEFPKKARSICFVGKEGYDILDFFDKYGEQYDYGKSGLVIELLKIYREAVEVYGARNALFKLKMNIERDKE